jgi:hypothetical protein
LQALKNNFKEKKMSIIETLTEGMVNRNMQQEGASLLNKWSSTGLLEGLTDDNQKASMARLLENQARELLRESNTMAGGDVEGFAAVAFPIVRRVFAGLIANDLVSVQPMSLPSGLIFFLDFKFSDTDPGRRLGQTGEDSIYGQGIVGSQVTGGVVLDSAELDKQPYAFGSAYSSPTASIPNADTFAGTVILNGSGSTHVIGDEFADSKLHFDPDLLTEKAGNYVVKVAVAISDIEGAADFPAGTVKFNRDHLSQLVLPLADTEGAVLTQVRRLTEINADDRDKVNLVYYADQRLANALTTPVTLTVSGAVDGDASFPIKDQFEKGASHDLGAIRGAAAWGLENEGNIPEIDIKVDSIALTATTKKLKAKWTPELGQDLNAYHNLDAEVELTSILSEQIALEIDREILSDLIKGATAGTFYWSRSPGMFVDRTTGEAVSSGTVAPDFTGTVSQWYETLIETINDVSAQIHRKTLRGGANFVVLSPEVANVLEFTAGFRANITADADKGDIGAVKVGSLNRKFDVIVDPYFPRNAILVGRKGNSFLESGYVYAPYVPLQTTPTIFGPEDFVPRKGVMTRYGKKMVRPDMYGLVIVRGLLGNDEV